MTHIIGEKLQEAKIINPTEEAKVAEVAAKCRLRGMSVKETIDYTLKNSPAMIVR